MLTMSKRKPVTYTIDADLLAELDVWLEAQPVKHSKTAVVEAALRDFLKKRRGK